MNLHHLRYFVTLAHLEHYTKAAKQLSITQPSLSHAIASLEDELNVRLFEKDGRNVVLTRWGKIFLQDVEEILAHLDSSVENLKMTGSGNGTIEIGCIRILAVCHRRPSGSSIVEPCPAPGMKPPGIYEKGLFLASLKGPRGASLTYTPSQ